MDLDDLITATEAAKLAKMKRPTFTAYVSRGSAPQPVATVAGRRLYARKDIKRWLKNRAGQGSRADLKRKAAAAK